MSYEFYKILHLISMSLLFIGLTGVATLRWAVGVEMPASLRKTFMIFHGVALLVILVTGFGLAARLNYFAALPGWIYGKLAIWLFFGGAIALAKRKGHVGWPLLILFSGVFGLAAWLAVTKPF